jgi:hypothetical protein
MSNHFGTDPFFSIIGNEFEKIRKEYSETKGIRAKGEVLNDIYRRSFLAYVHEIKSTNSETFEALWKKRMDSLMELAKAIPEKLKQVNLEGVNNEDIISMALSLEPEPQFLEKIQKEMDGIDLGVEEYGKLFLTEFTSKFELFYIILSVILELMPLLKLGDIVKKRFNSDYNWGLAVAILATQENLVKKKLIDLGMSKQEINKFLKQNTFSNLVDLLADKIKKEENRQVKLSFYKPSSLRDVRNKIEHEGYEVKVESDDILDLINDVEKLDKELFPDKKH